MIYESHEIRIYDNGTQEVRDDDGKWIKCICHKDDGTFEEDDTCPALKIMTHNPNIKKER